MSDRAIPATLAEIRTLVHDGLVVVEHPPGIVHVDEETRARIERMRSGPR